MKGQRVFEPPVIVSGTPWIKKVVTGRFTRSGKIDFAILCWETDGRCVIDGVSYGKGFLVKPFINVTPAGAGAATFLKAAKIEFADNAHRVYDMYNSDIAVGDVNNDGLDDIVVANSHSDRIFVYLSNGDGTFQAPIEILDTGKDDPCYVTLGDFNGDGTLDLAVMHTRRVVPGSNYEFLFAFLFGNGDGTFQSPVIKDEGTWSHNNDAEDAAFYYHSNAFNFMTIKKSVLVGGTYRDAVSLNGLRRWWDGAAIQSSSPLDTPTVKETAPKRMGVPIGSNVMQHYNPMRGDLVDVGGLVTRTSITTPADLVMTNGDPEKLDKAWLGFGNGSPLSLIFGGVSVIADDFDKDGVLDLLIPAGNVVYGAGQFGDPNYDGETLLLLYGENDVTNPWTLTTPDKVAKDRVSFLDNLGGIWYRGHHSWKYVSADFDGDGFPDLLTITAAGVSLHTNAGIKAIEVFPPEVAQVWPQTPHDPGEPSDPWYKDIMNVTFRTFDQRKVLGVILRRVGPTPLERAIFFFESSGTSGKFLIPDDQHLPPGDYDLFVFNGPAESTNSYRIKIILRPLKISSLIYQGVPKGESRAILDLSGFFGAEGDLRETHFSYVDAGRTRPSKTPVTRRLEEEHAKLGIDITDPAGSYELHADNPPRTPATATFSFPNHSPVLTTMVWFNKDGTSGRFDSGSGVRGAPMKPGGVGYADGSMLYAPDTKRWELIDSADNVKQSGTGSMITVALPNNNSAGEFKFDVPSTLDTSLTGLRFRVVTGLGLRSNAVGPLSTGKDTTDPTLPWWYVGVEQLDDGDFGLCQTHGLQAEVFNQTDPSKKPGALQLVKAMYPVGLYEFTQLSKAEFDFSPCLHRDWEAEGQDSMGVTKTVIVTAITEKRARINAMSGTGGLVSITSIKLK